VLTTDSRFNDCADEFQHIGDAWEAIANRFHELSETPDPAKHLAELVAPLQNLADQEHAAWQNLQALSA
jgi:hypothetical protein